MTRTGTTRELTHEEVADDRVMFGFWVYLMTDLLMFAVLFAVYAVLHGNTLGGPSGRDLFSPTLALVNTVILLTSSLTCGLGMIAARRGDKNQTLLWFTATLVLGATFLAVESYELIELIREGHGPRANAFLSSFFALVGTHGLHIVSGLIWGVVTLAVIMRRGLNRHTVRKLALLSLFWHFLDIVWIFIYSVVYLMAFV